MMTKVEQLSASVLEHYPNQTDAELQKALWQSVHADKHKIVVLDDDPTGVQTVHDLSVYTDWSVESIRRGFAGPDKLFFILTNSRGFTVEQTTKAHEEIGERLAQVAAETGLDYVVISRSDSTLRGHYPLETQLLATAWEKAQGSKMDGEILCPYFREGGRFTLNNIHYVRYGDKLVPAGETEFARDKTFAYRSSDLTEYIEEKTGGAFKKESVTCISLEELRERQIALITAKLIKVQGFNKVIVNAVAPCDVKVFVIALYQALAAGKHFLFRSAAGLVKEMGAVTDKPLLTRDEMIKTDTVSLHGGIVVVGSHTQKTTSQLEVLKTLPGVEPLEFNSDLVLQPSELDAEVDRIVAREEELLRFGRTVVVYTKRKLLSLDGETKEAALERSVQISEAVQSLVGRLKVTPAFVVAKGGITSSDIGTKALQVKRARVLGQIQPGIPVWETEPGSRFPGIPYVIFPGNVGEEGTLKEVVRILQG
jgi:uncharacterized protein YgbK (DUF1537 family)